MTMVFEKIQTAGIAQLSYLIGDDGSQTAAVVDPDVNTGRILQRRSVKLEFGEGGKFPNESCRFKRVRLPPPKTAGLPLVATAMPTASFRS